MVIGLLICYAFGTAWFMISTGTGLWSAITFVRHPFLPGDALKIIVAAILAKKTETTAQLTLIRTLEILQNAAGYA